MFNGENIGHGLFWKILFIDYRAFVIRIFKFFGLPNYITVINMITKCAFIRLHESVFTLNSGKVRNARKFIFYYVFKSAVQYN